MSQRELFIAFLDWLVEQEKLQQFWNAICTQDTLHSYTEDLSYIGPHCFVDNAISWMDTSQGYTYWSNTDTQWQLHLETLLQEI